MNTLAGNSDILFICMVVSQFQATRTRDAVQQCSFVLLEMMFEITSSLLLWKTNIHLQKSVSPHSVEHNGWFNWVNSSSLHEHIYNLWIEKDHRHWMPNYDKSSRDFYNNLSDYLTYSKPRLFADETTVSFTNPSDPSVTMRQQNGKGTGCY